MFFVVVVFVVFVVVVGVVVVFNVVVVVVDAVFVLFVVVVYSCTHVAVLSLLRRYVTLFLCLCYLSFCYVYQP